MTEINYAEEADFSAAASLRKKAVRLDQNLTAKRLAALNIETKDVYRLVVWEIEDEMAMIVDIYEVPNVSFVLTCFNRTIRQNAAAKGWLVTIEAVTL